MESTVRQQISINEHYLKIYKKTNKMILRVLTFLFYIFLTSNHASHLSIKNLPDFTVVNEEVSFYLDNAPGINSTIIFSHTAATELNTTTSFSINDELEIVYIKENSWNSNPVYLIKVRQVTNKQIRLQIVKDNSGLYRDNSELCKNNNELYKANIRLCKDNSWLYKGSCYINIFSRYKTKDNKSFNLVTHRFLTV